MAQNVRGQTLIDAIVEVFQEAPAARPLTAAEVASQLRGRGFWSGKEPKAAEQVVESYLATKHAGMFEPGANGVFALKPVYFRPAARSAALATALSTAASARAAATPPHRPGAAPKPVSAKPAVHSTAKPVPATTAPAPAPETKAEVRKRKRRSFGGASVAYFAPGDVERVSGFERVDVHLSVEEALKLHLSLGQLLAKVNGARHAGKARRETVAAIRVNFTKQRITLYAKPRKRGAKRDHHSMPPAADWGVEPG